MPVLLNRRHFLAGGLSTLALARMTPVFANGGQRPALPIPAIADGRDGTPVTLDIRKGSWSFMQGVQTPTLGLSQDYLGPTIRTRKNTALNLQYKNGLDEGVSIHGHGLHVPGNVDGGPQLEMAPGASWSPVLDIVQPAATCWYHSHTHGRTGYQTYHGLAGMMIIDDDDSDAMDLPNRYGVDDLPVVIQDRSFDKQGRLVYSLEEAGEDGWFGDSVVINGAMSPVASVPAGKVRLRLLNGANARFFIVTFADNRVFHKIATDGGLLEAPVPMTTMEMSPGERCEIIVDMADGNTADLLTLFEDVVDAEEEGVISGMINALTGGDVITADPSLTLQVDVRLAANTAPLPDRLVTIDRPAENLITRTRDFTLIMEGGEDAATAHQGHAGHQGGHGTMSINGAMMDMNVINERVKKGQWERWRVRSDAGAHPFHVHGCSFLVENMEGAPVTADQAGWKDTVVLDDDDWSTFIVRFDHEATEAFPYMYHCHILEHEDHGMMGQFTVT